jgi:mannose-6-phosphate isomerase class I
MGYESYETIEELLEDSDATEFRAIVPDIPVTLSRQELLDWDEPGWSSEYQEALEAFKTLAGSAADYDGAMARVKELQEELADSAEETPQPDQEQVPQPGPEQVAERVPEPAEAVAEVAQAITVPAIQSLQEQYPDVAARFTPEQIQAAAMAATTAVVSEPGR